MEDLTINKSSYVPMYKQLVEQFARSIRSGDLTPGTKMPSEREIADTLNVSRTTARQAIDELVNLGIVFRAQGKGTYVAEPGMRDLLGFTSFTDHMKGMGFKPSSKIITQELIEPDEEMADALRLRPGEKVLFLRRIRLADGKPVAIQTSHIPEKLVPGLVDENLSEKSFFEVLRTKYYVFPAWSEAKVESAACYEDEAKYLNIEKGSSVLVVHGMTYTDTFDMVESVKTVYRGGITLHIGRQKIIV
jgi:GntR family transcriptional regulator